MLKFGQTSHTLFAESDEVIPWTALRARSQKIEVLTKRSQQVRNNKEN